ISFALTLSLALLLQHFAIKIDLSLLIIAALIGATWYGGTGPGLLVAILFELTTIVSSFVRAQPHTFSYWFTQFNTIALLMILVLLVSSRKKVEGQLREQREWFSVTLSSIGDAVIA